MKYNEQTSHSHVEAIWTTMHRRRKKYKKGKCIAHIGNKQTIKFLIHIQMPRWTGE